MLKEVLKTRAKLLKKMVPSGQFSMSDLCRFFEVDKTRIEAAARMENLDLSKLRKEPNPKMGDFLQKRDQKFGKVASEEGLEAACIQFGLATPPILLETAREVKEAFSLDAIAKEMDLPLWEKVKETKNIYEGIFQAENLWEADGLTKFVGLDLMGLGEKITADKKEIEAFEAFKDYDWRILFQKGKVARLAENDMILELSIIGEKASNIAQWADAKKLQNDIKTFSDLISEKGFSMKPDRETLKELLLKGETAKDIKNTFSISMNKDLPALLDEIRCEKNREGKGALDFRRQIKINSQKDVFFDEYVKNGLTQQEIADKYGTTRVEVNQVLKEVKKERNDELMDLKMNFWRTRNTTEPLRKRKEMREKSVLENYDYDKSYSQIARESHCSATFVKDFLEIKGLSIASKEARDSLKKEIQKEYEAGTSISDIANIFGKKESTINSYIDAMIQEKNMAKTRENLMRMAYKEEKTTPEISKIIGMSQHDVLYNQKKSSRYILGHPELKPPVIVNKGDVPGIFSDPEKTIKKLTQKKEREDLEER